MVMFIFGFMSAFFVLNAAIFFAALFKRKDKKKDIIVINELMDFKTEGTYKDEKYMGKVN